MKGFLKSILILTIILCFALPVFAVKILPYNMPLHDIMSWDQNSATLKIANPEGESVSVAWASTVDLWNYDGTTWTFDLPSGNTFAFGKAITGNIGLNGFVNMFTQGTGLALTTAYPFGFDLHVKPVTVLTAGSTGLSCGIRMRYEVGEDQTNMISIIAVEGRLRVKKDLADGVHAGIEGVVEASETGTVLGGTSTTQTTGGHFALALSSDVTVSAGWLTGVVVDSSINSGVSLASCTLAGLRVKKTGNALNWEYGVYVANSDVGIYIDPATVTSGLLIGAASTSSGSGLRIGTGTTVPIGFYFDDGGVAVTAWGEGFTVGTVYTAASTAQGQTGMPYTAFFYNDVRAAFNGAASAGWSAVMMNFAITGAFAGFEVGVSALHTSVDINATSSLSEETTLSCISFGGNWIAGTYDASTDGLIVPLNVRSTNQNWSALLHLPSSANGCYATTDPNSGGSTHRYLKLYIGTDLYTIDCLHN